MKLGIFFRGNIKEGMDCRYISSGNPGFAGTPYMFCLISYLLSTRENGIEVILFTPQKALFPKEVKVINVSQLMEAYHICQEKEIDYFLFKHHEHYSDEELTMFTQEGKTKLLIWCHNFADNKALKLYAKSKNVIKIINVGREQLDTYRDHRAFLKSEYIYNSIDVPRLTTSTFNVLPFSQRKNIVTYMGAVVPGKGFHILAKAWKEVLKDIPDAELYVIGNGELYGGGKLGKWNLAEENYENKFMKYLTEGDKLLPGVHLMGIMGKEKEEILGITKVGVPNPSGLTETFCICGVEMQMAGARIAAYQCAGYLDTIRNGTIYKKRSQLAASIIRELQRKDNNYDEAISFINEHFSQEIIAAEWERLLTECIPKNTHLHDIYPLAHPCFELKRLKDRLRLLKSKFPILYSFLPTIDTFISLWKKAGYKIFKLHNGF